mgnify:CR=1 FL=1
MNISHLVEKIKKGDNKSFEKLYKLTEREVWFTCISFLKNETTAQDIMQETYITAFLKIQSLEKSSQIRSWLNRIAVNKCKNYLKGKGEIQLDDEIFENQAIVDERISIPEEYISDKAKREIILSIMQEVLSDVQYQTVIMHYFNEMTVDEIISKVNMTYKRVTLTGGEPLVRKGCASLVKQIKAIPGIEKVTLTTNGILLAEQLDALLDAGIDAINISLDTLDSELFKKVARRDGLEKVFEGIEAALAHPGLSLKINSVPVIKEKENFIGIAGLAQKYPIHVRFIEMMPIGFGKQFPFQDEESIKAVLEEAYGPMHAVNERYGNGPCHYYEIAGFKGKIGFISAMTHKFCSQCNRVRLTSEGFMKGCLQYQKGTDLRGLMRGGCTDSELKKAIYQVIWNKPVSHNFYEAKTEQDEIRGMSQIGG